LIIFQSFAINSRSKFYIIIIIPMPRPNLLAQLLVVAFLVLLTLQSNSVNYIKSASAPNMRSSFQVPTVSAGSIISVYINQNGAKNSFTLLLWNAWQSYPGSSPEQSAALSGSVNYTSSPLRNSGGYRIEILPSTVGGSSFPFSIRIQVDNITVGSYSDVARYDRIFPYYHQGMGTYTVSASVQLASANSTITLKVYGPFKALQVTGGNLVSASSNSGSSVTYSSTGGQYYYLVVHVSDALMLSNQMINVKYMTDVFACPYDQQAYPDYNGVYQGCSNAMPTVGYPCFNFDSSIQKCVYCYQPYVANSLGVCIQNTNCPQNQYYQYGQCFDVIANCADF
jgi:hypothetical protein